jgi:hypothetical protein
MAKKESKLSLTFEPLTVERWSDLEKLFGERGACGGCWCMSWRSHRAQFEARKGARNKAALRKIVEHGPPPGVLIYSGTEPVGWCAVAPREVHARLENSRILARVDDQPVWSITCFFVKRTFRRVGVSVLLLKAAAAHSAVHGARIVRAILSSRERILCPTSLPGQASPRPFAAPVSKRWLADPKGGPSCV